MNVQRYEYPQVKPDASMGILEKICLVRDCIDSALADMPSQPVEAELYRSRLCIMQAIREVAAKLPQGAA